MCVKAHILILTEINKQILKFDRVLPILHGLENEVEH